jgi:putative cell wall-binding protein
VSQQVTPVPGLGVPAVYIATGLQFPDALAGAPAANGDSASMLLVQQNLIPNETKAELSRLKPLKIYVLGGPAVISNTVFAALDAYDRGGGVVRLSGANRYATGAAIVIHAFPTTAASVIIANGTNFPDALAGGAAAAAHGMPLLLTQPGALPAETTAQLNRLNPSTIYVLGGTLSVSTTVENALKNRANHPTVTRLAGTSRYDTAVKISQQFFTAGGHTHMWVATGATFPDALAAGPQGEPLLLTAQAALPSGVAAEATRLNPNSITVLGGPTIVSNNVITQLQGT